MTFVIYYYRCAKVKKYVYLGVYSGLRYIPITAIYQIMIAILLLSSENNNRISPGYPEPSKLPKIDMNNKNNNNDNNNLVRE